MRRLHIIFLPLLIAPTSLSWAYIWDKDMVDQPSEKAQESIAPPGPGSVPIDGGESMPIPTSDAENAEMKEAAATLENPVPATAESIARGEYFYGINCLVCHGVGGVGDGPVGVQFVEKAPVDLNDVYTQEQPVGQLFFTLTRGRATMPFYRDSLSPSERWDVINYVKSEFGDDD